jgi:hypothetical protein
LIITFDINMAIIEKTPNPPQEEKFSGQIAAINYARKGWGIGG